MKRINFGAEAGNKIAAYNSVLATYTKVLRTEEPASIGLIRIEKGGVVGYHEAPVPQLFIVVNGEGWVEGEDENRIYLKSGEGVFWSKGEGHMSGSAAGLTALVLESKHLDLPSSI